jgi:hypothetical protein
LRARPPASFGLTGWDSWLVRIVFALNPLVILMERIAFGTRPEEPAPVRPQPSTRLMIEGLLSDRRHL